MKKILCLLIAFTFLTGCALTTIRPPKKKVAAEPERRTIIEKVREIVTPRPAAVKEEKEEILKEKEEVLPVKPKKEKEEVLPSEEDIK